LPPAGTNRLIASLPRRDRQQFLAGCEPFELVVEDILAEPGEPLRQVLFPTTGFISLTTTVDEHATLEVGLVGDEGMLGASLVLGITTSPLHALVQGEGMSLCMKTARFRLELERSTALQHLLKRYLYVILSQLVQTAACTRFHVVETRLARWLLMTEDRAHSNQFHITHEFLAYMLGVRRVGVTKAATSLQQRKLIRYTRGNITVLDHDGLVAAACDCYEADKTTYRRIMR
jgi:CRP-like cAMP-binding protein